MIPARVRKLLEENLWYLATCGEMPHVVPVGFKCVCADGRLAVGALLLDTTLNHIRANGKIAVAAADPMTGEAYQITGHAELCTQGDAFDHYLRLTEQTFHGQMQLKCVVLITPETLTVASPDSRNKTQIPMTGDQIMQEKEQILAAMKQADEPLNAGKIAELTGLDRKAVDKAMAAMKKEGSIVSPVRCKWEPAES